MLGRLCRWLRALGQDCEIVGQPPVKHQQQQQQQQHTGQAKVAQLAMAAASQGRIFLTRDARLANRKDCAAAAPYLLSTDDPAQQLREVSVVLLIYQFHL